MTSNEEREEFLAKFYPMGTRVRFVDGNANVSKKLEDMVMTTGFVNGKPMVEGKFEYVPVFAQREGREGTTIWVATSNIVQKIIEGTE